MTASPTDIWPARSPKADGQAIISTFPTWIRPYLPTQPEHQIRIIWSEKTGFGCWFSDSGYIAKHPGLNEAYKSAQKFFQDQYEMVLDKSLLQCPQAAGENPEVKLGWGFSDDDMDDDRFDFLDTVQMALPNNTFSMMFSRTWENDLSNVTDSFLSSHKALINWYANQSEQTEAFAMLNQHPMFWTFRAKENGDSGGWWSAEHGMSLVQVEMFRRADGDPIVRLETGPHLDTEDYPAHQRYLDMDLTADAPTFEEAIVGLARNIYQRYSCCGVERKRSVLPALTGGNVDSDCYFYKQALNTINED